MEERNEVPMRKAFFLDRDGVINEEVSYLHTAADTRLIPRAAEAIRMLRDAGYLAIVATNQSGVARGYYDLEAVHEVHREIQRQLAEAGAAVDGFYICPHHPEITGECSCRKPGPGMLLTAAAEHDIDLAESFMVGDRPGDLEAGVAAGVRKVFLVRSGYGAEVLAEKRPLPPGTAVADDLLDAVQMALKED